MTNARWLATGFCGSDSKTRNFYIRMTNRFVAFLVDNYFFFLFFSTDSRHHELREDSLLERAASSMEVQNSNLMMVQTVCEGIN